MNKMLRNPLICALLLCVTFLIGCGLAQIAQVMQAINEDAPALVRSYKLDQATTERVLAGFNEITQAVKTFNDNRTRGNLRNIINVIDAANQRGAFQVKNEVAQQRITAIISTVKIIINTIKPPEAAAAEAAGMTSADSDAPVVITEEQKKQLEPLVDELKRLTKH